MATYIFDFDGTLANSGKTGDLATKAAFKELGLPVPTTADINYYMGIPIEVSFKKMAPNHHFSDTEFEQLLNIFRSYYRQFENDNLTLFSGIDDVLAELVKRGHQLYVVSSKHSQALTRNLISLHIDQYFTQVIGSDQVEHFKPAPDGVLAVLNCPNVYADTTVMIGDAIFDLQMGKAAGVHTCGVTWGAHDVKALKSENPDYLLDDPTELLSI